MRQNHETMLLVKETVAFSRLRSAQGLYTINKNSNEDIINPIQNFLSFAST